MLYLEHKPYLVIRCQSMKKIRPSPQEGVNKGTCAQCLILPCSSLEKCACLASCCSLVPKIGAAEIGPEQKHSECPLLLGKAV